MAYEDTDLETLTEICVHGTEWPDGDPGCRTCIEQRAEAKANHDSHTWIIGCDEGCCCRCMFCDTRWGGKAAEAERCPGAPTTFQLRVEVVLSFDTEAWDNSYTLAEHAEATIAEIKKHGLGSSAFQVDCTDAEVIEIERSNR